MSSTDQGCPFCLAQQPKRGWPFTWQSHPPVTGWQALCPSCGATGPAMKTVDHAYDAWTADRTTPLPGVHAQVEHAIALEDAKKGEICRVQLQGIYVDGLDHTRRP